MSASAASSARPATEPAGTVPAWVRYTKDLTDEQLERRWRKAPQTLGSMSIGFPFEGRVINAVTFPKGEAWKVISPAHCWGTQETVDFVITAAKAVAREFPGTDPLRVNAVGAKDGGWVRPHESHQSGRDVDLGFYDKPGMRFGPGWRVMDLAKNWALLKALFTKTDVQFVLTDWRNKRKLYKYALSIGENKSWLDSIFYPRHGRPLIKHARGHRDHFHVRFYNARAQELGRRIEPLLAKRPDQNLAFHRVRRGDCLSRIARRLGSTVVAIRRANHMRSNFLRLGRVLVVPLRGPCTRCPIPPEVIVPPRRLPPAVSPVAGLAPEPTSGTAAPRVTAAAARVSRDP